MIKNLWLAVLVGSLLLAPCSGAHASSLGIAGEFNLFMFGNIIQWGTDVEGRIAAGGNVVYGRSGKGNGFAVASKVKATQGPPELVAGGSVRLTNGSVGYFAKENSGAPEYQNGTIVYGGKAKISQTVGYGSAYQGNPINFKSEQNYLKGMSAFWGGLASTGQVLKPNSGQVYLTGSNPNLNIFNIDSSYLTKNLGFFLNVPQTSTVLLNIVDANSDKRIRLTNIGFYMAREFMEKNFIAKNDAQAMLKYLSGKDGLYPHSNILFNFVDAERLLINRIEINGSILAPNANVSFGKHSHIDGSLIANSLFGRGEAHNIRFNGKLPIQPVPEPATIVLLVGGLLGLAAWRRRY